MQLVYKHQGLKEIMGGGTDKDRVVDTLFKDRHFMNGIRLYQQKSNHKN